MTNNKIFLITGLMTLMIDAALAFATTKNIVVPLLGVAGLFQMVISTW